MKELMAVASQPAIKFDKEGVLFFKDKQDGILFRKSDGMDIFFGYIRSVKKKSFSLFLSVVKS